MSLFKRDRSKKGHGQVGPGFPVCIEDGTEIGIVFQYDNGQDCTTPGLRWYAISHATRAQVGPDFDSKQQAEVALLRAEGASTRS